MWEPLQRRDNDPNWVVNPEMTAIHKAADLPMDDETWTNDRYQVRVRYIPPTTKPGSCTNCDGLGHLTGWPHTTCSVCEGSTREPTVGFREGLVHLSINAHDRGPMRNWRHLQQIKNEIMGEDRWAMEVFPPEDHLTDTSNQYHLWVMPEDQDIPFGFRERLVSTEDDVGRYNDEPHKGRQEPWEEGITAGRRADDRSMYGDQRLTQPGVRPTEAEPPA